MQNIAKKNVYIHMETRNKSFREMHYFLKAKGIKHNDFFLALLDPDLRAIDPFDPNINEYIKRKILLECSHNYWYFLREVVRIPMESGTGEGSMFKLHRGNLAMNFCVNLNLDIFFELSRQLGKTLSVLIRLLWEFNFGSTNSTMLFLHKNKDGSKDNLRSLKIYRNALPSYLQMANDWDDKTGKKLKPKNNVETLEHIRNGNRIKTASSATSKGAARAIGRGAHVPRIYFDEYAFAKFNSEIYLAMAPAFKTASENAKHNHGPYGIIFTTTPGDLTTEEGEDACKKKDLATPFSEEWYDWSEDKIREFTSKNTNSTFVYIRFTYKQIGKSEEWLAEQIKQMQKDYDAIRREILLEWSHANLNSPFDPADLEIVKSKLKNPIKHITLRNYYDLEVYELPKSRDVPIIGVDPAGGAFNGDSSAITVINSRNTHVCMCFNCNFISIMDLAAVLVELVSKYLPNAVVNIERNGGFGFALLARLKQSKIKRNLYYEIKEKVIEERFDGVQLSKNKKRVKVYGTDNTKNTRDLLLEILKERMTLHKDKFLSPMLFKELEALEVKRNGRVEATSNAHDDQVFSYLMAMYVWYEGIGLKERWGIDKISLRTDQDQEEDIDDFEFENEYMDVTKTIDVIESQEAEKAGVEQQLDYLASDKSMLNSEWEMKQAKEDQDSLNRLLSTDIGREAYSKKYHKDPEELQPDVRVNIPDEVFNNFYENDDEKTLKM